MTRAWLAVPVMAVLVLGLFGCGTGTGEGEVRTPPGQQGGEAGQAAMPGEQGSVLRFRTAVCNDPQGTGIECLRLIIPSDWKFESGVNWLLDKPMMPAYAWFTAWNPDGAESFRMFPNQSYFWTDNELITAMFPAGAKYFGNEVRQPVTALAALKSLVLPSYYRDASGLRITQEQRLPELARALGVGQQSQAGVSTSGDAAKVRVEYTRDGVELEEEVYAVVEQLAFQVQTMYGWRTNTVWNVNYTFGFRAAKGQLDRNADAFQTMAHSIRLNPGWYAKYVGVTEYLIGNQIERTRSMTELSGIIARTGSQLREEQMADWTRRQAVGDRVAENFSDYMRGVERYHDPVAGEDVKLPSGYENAWVNGLGEYVMSERHDFNPNIGSTQNWQRLTR
jgi:hypothetical protein